MNENTNINKQFTERMGGSFTSINGEWKLIRVEEEQMHHPKEYNLVSVTYLVPEGEANFNDLNTFQARAAQTVKGTGMFTVRGNGNQVIISFVYIP